MPVHETIKSRPEPSEAYEFGAFRLDVREQVLERCDTGERIPLPAKAFETLCVLLRNSGRLVEKEELLSEVWAGSFVEENNLNKSIHAIRRALGESGGEQRFIETVKKRGFRFVAEVRNASPGGARTSGRSQLNVGYGATVREFPHLVQRPEASSSGVALAVPATPVPDEETNEEPSNVVRPAADALPAAAPITNATGLRPLSSRSVAAAVIAAAIIVILGGAAFFYRNAKPTAAAGDGTAPRLAVLPLKPVNAEGRDLGLELAVADSLILKLNESKVFRVSSLSSVRSFVEIDIDPAESGRQLGVDYVLASNYQIADGRIRVTSQLIAVDSGATEQTFKTESPKENIFVLQDAVANAIGNDVLARFGRPATNFAASRGTENEEAHNLFYEALYLVDKNTREDSAKAADLLGQAVILDPSYAQAWALRAQAYCQFGHAGGGVPNQLFTIAEPMLDKALALENNNVTALMVRGTLNRDYHWRFDDAYRDINRSIELDPNRQQARRVLAGLYYRDRRFADALAEQKAALELNPTSVIDRWFLGLYLINAGRPEDGVAQIKRALDMDPTLPVGYETLWQLYHREGDAANAYSNFIKAKELYGTKPDHLAALKSAFAKSGWPGVLRADLEQMKIRNPRGQYSGAAFYIATLAALCGERDTAFEYLEEALRFRLIGISYLKVDPRLDSIREDPRFEDILRRAGLGA